jgi:pimeloyl-ACP methyl ester carboxylesterase
MSQETKLDGWPLNRITCPTLILQGTADQSVPVADAEYAHTEIANSQLVELPGQGHMAMYVKHAQLSEMISKFLRQHL